MATDKEYKAVIDALSGECERLHKENEELKALLEPCQLLIIKSDILLHQDDRKKWMDSIKREKENGVIILPPYFEPLLVPTNIEINIEQEPCDDAISREAVLEWCGDINMDVYTNEVKEFVNQLPSVNPQKSGKWIDINGIYAECSNCNEEIYITGDFNYCPNCGCNMFEPQERSGEE